MATELERQRLRLDLGFAATDTTSLSDANADAYLTEAGERYTDSNSAWAAGRVIAIERMTFSAAAEVDYTQNNTQERASQRFDHLWKMLEYWRKKLADAIAIVDEADRPSAARFGRTTRKPARVREWPGWGAWW